MRINNLIKQHKNEPRNYILFYLQSEIGYGKMDSYIKLNKLGEVRIFFFNKSYYVFVLI